MAQISYTQALTGLVGLLLLAISGMIWAWGWVIWRLGTRRPIFSEPPMVDVGRPTWGAGTVLLVMLLYLAVGSASQWCYLWAGGRLPKKQPPAPPVATPLPAKPPKPLDSNRPDDRANLVETEQMFVVSIINSVLLVLIPVLVRLTAGAGLRNLGISLEGWMRQAGTGVAATLFVVPIVYLVQMMALVVWPADPSNDHPLKKMLEDQFTGGVVYLAILSAVILAPLLEELMFRAVLQGWLSGLLARRHDAIARHRRKTSGSLLALHDDGFATDLAEFGDTVPKFEITETTAQFSLPAIAVTSLFFAIVHFPQWPAPVPLFVLSLALGIVYQRTGSLIASSFMHATFNGLSTVGLIAALLVAQGQDAKNPTAKGLVRTDPAGAAERPRVVDVIQRR